MSGTVVVFVICINVLCDKKKVHSKMIEIMRKSLENQGKTLTIVEKYQTTLGRGNE